MNLSYNLFQAMHYFSVHPQQFQNCNSIWISVLKSCQRESSQDRGEQSLHFQFSRKNFKFCWIETSPDWQNLPPDFIFIPRREKYGADKTSSILIFRHIPSWIPILVLDWKSIFLRGRNPLDEVSRVCLMAVSTPIGLSIWMRLDLILFWYQVTFEVEFCGWG